MHSIPRARCANVARYASAARFVPCARLGAHMCRRRMLQLQTLLCAVLLLVPACNMHDCALPSMGRMHMPSAGGSLTSIVLACLVCVASAFQPAARRVVHAGAQARVQFIQTRTRHPPDYDALRPPRT